MPTRAEAFCDVVDGQTLQAKRSVGDLVSAFRYIAKYRSFFMDAMTRVSSTDFSKEVGRYEDLALTQPVVITRDGHDRTVMISAEEYSRLKHRDRRVFAAGELPEAMIEAVRRAEVDPRHAHLDRLLDDWTP